jgi:hypothetical protein
VAGLRCRAEIAPRHIGNHARAKGCRWCGLLNVHRNVLCQSRQNHLDQQHTPNTKTRATNSYAAQHPPQAPLSRSDFLLERFSDARQRSASLKRPRLASEKPTPNRTLAGLLNAAMQLSASRHLSVSQRFAAFRSGLWADLFNEPLNEPVSCRKGLG